MRPAGLLLFFTSLATQYRRMIVILIHLALICFSYALSFLLKYDGPIPNPDLLWKTLPVLLTIRGLTFVPFRLYEGLWRYTGIWDLRNIIFGVSLSSLTFLPFAYFVLGMPDYPETLLAIDSTLLILFLGGIRLVRRIYREVGHPENGKKILIYGAGDAGEMIVRDMKNNVFYNYEPIGFVDDDPAKVGQFIHGIRVLGSRNSLTKILREKQPTEILVAMPKAGPSKIREVVRDLEPFKIPIKTLPNLRDILDGRVSVSQIRNLSVEDLLDRAPVGLDPEPIRHLVKGKRVLVTGAGGSIGSELCRQIASLEPESLVLYERYENSLFEILNRLSGMDLDSARIHPIVGDIVDERRVDLAFQEHHPELIFHAAAHKHVPLMEFNPCEAVKNNVLGTRVVTDAATRYGAERFILISSDKAVNPSSVMGATKRVAEYLIHSMNHWSRTVFAAVRFGNVLGSNGSVVPLFLEQIKAGGPVTVTHPEMRRYFMLISEAVFLVLQAAALARAGEIYVLEMGEQIKVLELARNLVRLTGFVPDQDIPITFVGRRPGEKLSEELIGSDESVNPSEVEKILRVHSNNWPETKRLHYWMSELVRQALDGQNEEVIQTLREIVPTYSPIGRDDIPSEPIEEIYPQATVS